MTLANDGGSIRNLQRDQDAAESEASFQRRAIRLALDCGWKVYHPYDSRKSAEGYPDLTLARNGARWHWELKTMTGKLTAKQRAWGEALGDSWRCLRPSDWDWIVRVLQ